MSCGSLCKRTWLYIVSFGLLIISHSVLAGGEESFNKGLTAYRAGHYEAAIGYFEKARKQGLNRVSVYYNLGSSYYRLEKYDQAISMFERVIRSGKMADIANFNLGLIARKQDNNKLAKKYFLRTISISKNRKLIYLARKNIREIEDKVGVWRTTVLADTGYNDNISNTATGLVGGGDAFFTVAAFTHALLSGSGDKGWSAHGEFFNRSYSTISGYGLGSLSGGIIRNTRLFGKNVYAGGYYKYQTIDGAPYQNIIGFESGLKNRTDSGARYDYRYRLESIDTSAVYSYLQGTRQRFRVQRVARLNKHSTLILAYRLELNDRQNSPTASFTNVRHGLRASYYKSVGNDVTWRVAARYRVSDYTAVAPQDRYDNLVQFSVQRRKTLHDGLEWFLQYSLSRNDSTDPVYTYTSNTYKIGLRKHF
jgi:hypothetical protein